MTDEYKLQVSRNLINDKKNSNEEWNDYFLSQINRY
jgi:hypothetical protein